MKLSEKELLTIRGTLLMYIDEHFEEDTNTEEALLDKIDKQIWNLRYLNSIGLKAKI